jgi:hypothetical protein
MSRICCVLSSSFFERRFRVAVPLPILTAGIALSLVWARQERDRLKEHRGGSFTTDHSWDGKVPASRYLDDALGCLRSVRLVMCSFGTARLTKHQELGNALSDIPVFFMYNLLPHDPVDCLPCFGLRVVLL